jgi:putative ABC transport system permease protein
MIRHYLKSAWRFLSRFKSHTLLNSIGLSLGIAACGLILHFVKDELRYDRHFPEAESLHRVTTIQTSDDAAGHSAAAFTPVADALRTGISTSSVTRVYTQSLLFGRGDVRFQARRSGS